MLQYRDIGLTTKIRGADGENVFFFFSTVFTAHILA